MISRELIFILGGARSGKSTYAEVLAKEQGASVLYVATAQAWDEEMTQRIAVHQAERPSQWRTLEAAQDVGAAIRAVLDDGNNPKVILIDCLTMLANNVILALPEPIEQQAADRALRQEVNGLLTAFDESNATWIVVSNEVGLGIVPAYPLGRIYRDALGRANQQVATAANQVLFMVSGQPMVVKG